MNIEHATTVPNEQLKRLIDENAALKAELQQAQAKCAEMRDDYLDFGRIWHEDNHEDEGTFEKCSYPVCKTVRRLADNPGAGLLKRLEAADRLSAVLEAQAQNVGRIFASIKLAEAMSAYKAAKESHVEE